MSGIYHLLERGGAPSAVFLRLDHAGIWVLIAGTFTPIHTILFRGPWRWGILSLVWTIAITGLILRVVFISSIPDWLSIALYIGFGSLGVISAIKFIHVFKDKSIQFLFAGGVFYGIGAIGELLAWPTLWPGVIGPHELFHIFAIFGAASQWYFIYYWVNHPIKDQITFHIKVLPNDTFIATAIGEPYNLEANSLDKLKVDIKELVTEYYHHTIKPEIHLKYFKEEYL